MNKYAQSPLGGYLVSVEGDVFSKRRKIIRSNGSPMTVGGKKLKLVEGGGGYLTFCDGRRKRYLVHRIVARTYIPNTKNLPCINHRDGNKKNNHVSNLEWCTYKQNMAHAFENGLVEHQEPFKEDGETSIAAKLSPEDVLHIRYVYKNNKVTYPELAKVYDVTKITIANIVREETWRHL